MRFLVILFLLSCCAVLCNVHTASAARKIKPDAYRIEGVFPKDGAYHGVKWDLHEFPKQPTCWGSFGGVYGNDGNTGTLESPVFQTRAMLRTFVSGYPNAQSQKLQLVDKNSGETLELKVASNPGERWQYVHWNIPDTWKAREVTIQAIDNSPESWFGICEILHPTYKVFTTYPDFRPALVIVRELLWHFFWIAIPSAGLLAFLLIKVPTLPDRLLIPLFLVCAGTIAYLTFWFYFLDPSFGTVASIVITALLGALHFHRPVRSKVYSLELRKELWGPLLMMLGVATLYLSVDYLFGGLKFPLLTSSNRFLNALPVDNILPLHFAEVLSEGRPVRPFADIWNTSDRPPLQTAFVLWQYALMHSDVNYQILGTLVQTFLIAATWAFGRAFNLPRGAQFLVMGCIVFSGTTILHSLFVWPKLISAAYLLCAVVFLIVRKESTPEAQPWVGWFAGASVALGMLSHGASLFGVFAIASVFLFWNRPQWSFIWRAGICLIGLYLPWVCYQRFYDPPGDRLIKWHIAGTRAEDGVPAIDSIVDSYSQLTFSAIVDLKVKNLQVLFSGLETFSDRLRSLNEMVSYGHRQDSFFYFFYSLDILILGFIAYFILVVRSIHKEELKSIHFSFCLALVGILWWSLLMFGPSSTILHQGSFLISTVISFALALSLYFLSPTLAFGLLAWEALRWFITWVFAPLLLSSGDTFVYNSPQLDLGMLAAMLVVLVAAIVFLRRITVQKN